MKGTREIRKSSPSGSKNTGSPKTSNKQRENLEKFQQNRKSPKISKINSSKKFSELDAVRPFELKRLEFDDEQSIEKNKFNKSKSNSNEIPSINPNSSKTRKSLIENSNSSSNDSQDGCKSKKNCRIKGREESESSQGQTLVANLPTTTNEENLDTYSTLNSNRNFIAREPSSKNPKLTKINSNINEDSREIKDNLSSQGESPPNRGLLSKFKFLGDKISMSRKSSEIGVSRKSSHVSQSSSMSEASMSKKNSNSEMSHSQINSISSKTSNSISNNSISSRQKKNSETSPTSPEKNVTSQNNNDPVLKFLNFVEKKKPFEENSIQISPIRKISNLDVVFDVSSEIVNNNSQEDKKDLWKRSQEIMTCIFNSPIFSFVFLINIITALFLENLKIVILPKSWDHSIDVVMLAVFIFFLLEIILHIIFIQNYRFSFFFYADILAVCGLIPEIHIFYGVHDSQYTGEQDTE